MDGASEDIDTRVAVGATSLGVDICYSGIIGSTNGSNLATIATAIDVAVYLVSTHLTAENHAITIDEDGGVFGHITQLAAAIDVTLDLGIAEDMDIGLLGSTQLMPIGKEIGGIEFLETTHAGAEDVATLRMSISIVGRIIVSDNGIAADVDIDVSAWEVSHSVASVVSVIVAHHAVVINIGSIIKSIAHRGKTSATIDGAENLAASDVDSDRATHITSRDSLTAKATATTEDVAVDV